MAKLQAKLTTKLPSVWLIGKKSVDQVWDHRKHFGIILIFYALAYIIAVVAGSSSSVDTSQGVIKTYGNLISSVAGTNSPLSGAFQLVLFISLALVIVWSLKQFRAKKKISVKDALYKSSTPLIPFFLVFILIGIEFIPMLLASDLYQTVITNGIAVSSTEKVLWIIGFILLAILSCYLVTPSLIALYQEAQSGDPPMKVIKAANKTVKKRRLVVFSKIAFLPIALLVIIGLVMLPVILIVSAAAQWILFFLILISMVFAHAYMFNLSNEVSK